MTKKGLKYEVERLAKAERDRLGQNKDAYEKNTDDLNGRVAEFEKDWKAKYTEKFDIKDEDFVYNRAFASIIETPAENARTAAEKVGTETPGQTPAEAKAVETGRDTATVHINEGHGMPAL